MKQKEGHKVNYITIVYILKFLNTSRSQESKQLKLQKTKVSRNHVRCLLDT